MKASSKALKYLKPEELEAITLKFQHEKSTWEAGEIMKKAHYKYLEILGRGERFFKLFTQHFKAYDKLIPVDLININPLFKEYLTLVIQDRLEPRKIYSQIGLGQFRNRNARNQVIGLEIKKWEQSKNAHENYMAEFVKEFDRWNNYRILPEEVQEPHAFRRRQKNLLRKKLYASTALGDEKVRELKKYLKSKDKINCGWVYLISNASTQEAEIVPVILNNYSERIFSRLFIPIFSKKAEAEKALNLVLTYLLAPDDMRGSSRVKEGQKFWVEFRDLKSRALNSERIDNIIPERKDSLMFKVGYSQVLEDHIRRVKKRKKEATKNIQ